MYRRVLVLLGVGGPASRGLSSSELWDSSGAQNQKPVFPGEALAPAGTHTLPLLLLACGWAATVGGDLQREQKACDSQAVRS